MFKGITNIKYNHLNQPTEVDFGKKKTVYTYTATGGMLKTEIYQDGKLKSTTDYNGAFVYENNILSYINIPGGRIRKDASHASHYEYNLTDHLGNVRVTFKDSSGTAVIIQEDHYYPFGMRMNGQHFSNTDLVNKYLYNGKEQQEQTGYYDYGFRQLDPQLGRWHVVDAMAEKYMSTSPYAYVMNNPINAVDVMGLFMGGGQQSWSSYLKPYLDSNSSRHGGGMIYYNNFPGSLSRLSSIGAPKFGPTFEDYNTEINGVWVHNSNIKTIMKDGKFVDGLKGFYTHDNQNNLYSVAIDGIGRFNFKNGVKVSDVIGTDANGAYVKSWNQQFYKLVDAANKWLDNKELGPVGLGMSIELAFPGQEKIFGKNAVTGISFGFVADVKGLSWYYTRKTAKLGFACSISPEAFYVDGNNRKVYNNDLNGYGYSLSGGYGPYGIEFGTDNGADSGQLPKYHQYSLSGFAKGIDYSAVHWNTYTTITNLFYP